MTFGELEAGEAFRFLMIDPHGKLCTSEIFLKMANGKALNTRLATTHKPDNNDMEVIVVKGV